MKLYTEYQPILELKTHKVIGYESLLRGAEKPDLILKRAAQLGKLVSLDLYSMQLALSKYNPSASYKLFLNCHPKTFESKELIDFLQTLKKGLLEKIIVEVTEQSILDPLISKIHAKRLKDLGVEIAIDDFGQGQSYFHNIEILEPNIIKLDRSLIANISDNDKTRCLILGLLEMGKAIGTKILAEGIETKEQRNTLIDCGVQIGQGWYLGRPIRQLENLKERAIL